MLGAPVWMGHRPRDSDRVPRDDVTRPPIGRTVQCVAQARRQVDKPDVDHNVVGQRARDPLPNRVGVDDRHRWAGLERTRGVNQAGNFPVGGERDLDLGAWADERVSVGDEAIADMGVEQRSPLLLLGTIGADGDRGELRVPDHWAGRSWRQPGALKRGGGRPQRQAVGERHVPVKRCVVDAGNGDRDLRVVVRSGLGETGDDVRVLDRDAWNGEVLVAVHKRRLAIQPSQPLGGDPERLRQSMSLRLLDPRRHDPIHWQPRGHVCVTSFHDQSSLGFDLAVIQTSDARVRLTPYRSLSFRVAALNQKVRYRPCGRWSAGVSIRGAFARLRGAAAGFSRAAPLPDCAAWITAQVAMRLAAVVRPP